MSVRIGFLCDLRAAANLSSLDAQPLVFTVNNYRLRISAFAPSAATGTVALQVTHGISGPGTLIGAGVAFTTAAGFNANSYLYDLLATLVGLSATASGQTVTITDAGFDATGPFVDVQVIASSSPTLALVVNSGPATITAAADATATKGWTGRTATALTHAGPIRVTRGYDRNGGSLGIDLEAHLTSAANLVAATSTSASIDPGAAQRVNSWLLRPLSTEILVVRGSSGGFDYGNPAQAVPVTAIP